MIGENNEQLLALKVMRLTRPMLVSPQIISSEKKDLPQNTYNTVLLNDPTAITGCDNGLQLGAGQFMLLPQSLGNIYLGETFSSYICVHNCVSHRVEGVVLKADLKSNSSHISIPLGEKQQNTIALNPDATIDDVIHHEVKECGTHILVCEVHYNTPAGLVQSFRKFFKFEVMKPLDVKTKFYNVESNEIYLEAQIQNITSGPICLEKVELESSDHYIATSLNTLPNGESVFHSKNMLQTKNNCQFLYCIKPKDVLSNDLSSNKFNTNIGKLDIVWRSNLGERGHLQTSALERFQSENSDVEITMLGSKDIVPINKPFSFRCRVRNTSDKPMELQAKLNSKLTLDYTCYVDSYLGILETGTFKEFQIIICPTRLGLIKISQLTLHNIISKKTYEYDDVLQVYVIQETSHDNFFEMNKCVRYDLLKQ